MQIEGGNSIQLKKQRTVLVSFTNCLSTALYEAVLTVQGAGLLEGKQVAK